MMRLEKCYNLRFKIGVKIFFEDITGIRSQVPAIFSKNNEVVLGDFNQFIFLTWCCKWAQMVHLVKTQELQIAPKNRFHTNCF
jgi:hypothetical protein